MTLHLVNVTPQLQSGQTSMDSEASVTVNPANPSQAALTAFTPGTTGVAPLYLSTDEGDNWGLNPCMPGGNQTGDSSLRFAGADSTLYAAILRADNSNLNILRSGFPPAGVMTTLVSRTGADQPWVEAAWAGDGVGGTVDRVYVTTNGPRARLDFSLSARSAPAPAGFGTPLTIDARAGSNRPSIRTSVHRAGVVYGLYVHVRPSGTSDIVLVRDDNWGSNNFADLTDASDGVAGRLVATGVTIPAVGTLLGTAWVSSRLAVAVDPRDHGRVYVAWCDGAATASSPFTLHVRRSDDSGQTWTSDLRTVTNVTNPGLGVNVRGTVGLLYQRLMSPTSGNRWETHFELSDDHGATIRSNLTLADVADLGGTSRTLGDYANLVSVGKNFYGGFCAFNAPIAANFPNGVTYLRNADWPTQRLLANDGVTTVTPSIDAFFLRWREVESDRDFYVRDWTDSPTAGDDGVEPSTHPVFYTTSDVWNRRGTLPGSFPNDQPANEAAGNGAGNVGDNWAFARIRRRAAATSGAAVPVTAHLLVSKLGTGSNYVDASMSDPDLSFPDPDPTLSFAAGDAGPQTTTAFHWHLNPVASTHLCLAVEITAPGDPYVGSSLRGRAPGWPNQDLEILDDNNKAQRNMGLSVTPARGIESELVLYGLAHNAATWRRDMVLRFVIDDAFRRRLKRDAIHIIGSRRDKVSDGEVVLRGMEPGENRWIGFSFVPPRGAEGQIYEVSFLEMIGGAAINGFALGTQIGSAREVLAWGIERHRSVFTRIAVEYGAERAAAEAAAALKVRRPKDAGVWLRGLRERWRPVAEELDGITCRRDPFGVRAQLKVVDRALRSGRTAGALMTVSSLLERLDSEVTNEQLAIGDVADVLQTVRWQSELFNRGPKLSRAAQDVEKLCRGFISDWETRASGPAEYARLMDQMQPALEKLYSAGGDAGIRKLLDDLRSHGEHVAEIQGAHRRLLLKVERQLRAKTLT